MGREITDPEFIAYMRAFEESTKHLGSCPACQKGDPCKSGAPIHADFETKQDAWEAKSTRWN
ncbi:hypothetical protein OG357_25655 [Streptomyces sp. NBC_01255]|uniref:hypothetical protein n=1 Tax=Streptomyces sp. NBC_01255 TaxID=2903798 RepID=UPI002E336C35|nr:hypothetical protein [Streptomyces sp. NBC_01255]